MFRDPKVALAALCCLGVVTLEAGRLAWAGPTTSRSAVMAARLKKRPSSSWLAHYLPDDRYKIAGGVWKYVSTDLDTYYHRPDSPLMLRQSASGVIGFASAADAEEAGYRPGPGVTSSRVLARGQGRRVRGSFASGAAPAMGSGGGSSPFGSSGGRSRERGPSRVLTVPKEVVTWANHIQVAGTASKLLQIEAQLGRRMDTPPYTGAMGLLRVAAQHKRAALTDTIAINKREYSRLSAQMIRSAMQAGATEDEDRRDPAGAQQRANDFKQKTMDFLMGR